MEVQVSRGVLGPFPVVLLALGSGAAAQIAEPPGGHGPSPAPQPSEERDPAPCPGAQDGELMSGAILGGRLVSRAAGHLCQLLDSLSRSPLPLSLLTPSCSLWLPGSTVA